MLNHNPEWVQLALQGLRQCLYHNDLPTAADIVNLHLQSKRWTLTAPSLAAMELLYCEDPSTAFNLPEPLLETVLTFHFFLPLSSTPSWLLPLIQQHPSVVAAAMYRWIDRHIREKHAHIEGLSSLARDSSYAAIARQITQPLLENFPAKAHQPQLPHLRSLIVAALTNLDESTQSNLIASKLNANGMSVAQHAYWLTAGVLRAPEMYVAPVKAFVAKSQKRTADVFALINECRIGTHLLSDLSVSTQAFFITILGTWHYPNPSQSGSFWVTSEMEITDFVASLITSLASNPSDATTQALADLRHCPGLKHWEDHLNRAMYDQRITRRKALFQHASVQEVCATLANRQPASAADLWALTVDHLQQLIRNIRDGATNDYDQYWAGDTPNVEEICRNALLSHLKHRLAEVGVTAEPEARYADAKRADIKVIASPHHIPIEIKREMNPELWKAIAGQLIAKYGREQSSGGYGIYLVFWFTGLCMPAPTDGLARPKTPQELQARLTATVPEPFKHKIAVLVVDCAKPADK